MTRSTTRRSSSRLTVFLFGLASSVPAFAAEPCLAAVLNHESGADRPCSDLVAALNYERGSATSTAQVEVALASAYNNRAMARLDAGDLEGAATDLAEALTLAPASWAIYLNRGNLALTSGDPRAALADYERVLELAPEQAAAVGRNSALAWRALGNPAAAEQLLYRAANQRQTPRPADPAPGARPPQAPAEAEIQTEPQESG